jgi:hypothetical protein
MNFMLTASGAEYFLDGPDALAPQGRPILLRDIAHQAALTNRWNGATRRPYSVAEHSLLVSEISQRNGEPLIVQFAALLHDAHEAYTGDMVSPVKAALNAITWRHGGPLAWEELESQHAHGVRRYFGVLTVFVSHRLALRRYDLEALATERRDLTSWHPDTHRPWSVLGDESLDPEHIFRAVPWVDLASPERSEMTWRDWRQAYTDRFASIAVGLGLPDTFHGLA